MAPSALQQQGSVVVTEILWPTKTKAFTIFGSLQEKNADLCPRAYRIVGTQLLVK